MKANDSISYYAYEDKQWSRSVINYHEEFRIRLKVKYYNHLVNDSR